VGREAATGLNGSQWQARFQGARAAGPRPQGPIAARKSTSASASPRDRRILYRSSRNSSCRLFPFSSASARSTQTNADCPSACARRARAISRCIQQLEPNCRCPPKHGLSLPGPSDVKQQFRMPSDVEISRFDFSFEEGQRKHLAFHDAGVRRPRRLEQNVAERETGFDPRLQILTALSRFSVRAGRLVRRSDMGRLGRRHWAAENVEFLLWAGPTWPRPRRRF
jgi:hypothetical protein